MHGTNRSRAVHGDIRARLFLPARWRALLRGMNAAPCLDDRFFAQARAGGVILRKVRIAAGFDWNCLSDPLFFSLADPSRYMLARPGPFGPIIHDAAGRRVSARLVAQWASEVEGWAACEVDRGSAPRRACPPDAVAVLLATGLAVAAATFFLGRAASEATIAAVIAAATLAIHLWRMIALRFEGRARVRIPMALLWHFHANARGQFQPARAERQFWQFRSAGDYLLQSSMAAPLLFAGITQLAALRLFLGPRLAPWSAGATALIVLAVLLRLLREKLRIVHRGAEAERDDYLHWIAAESDRLAALATPEFLCGPAKAMAARIAAAGILEFGLRLGLFCVLALLAGAMLQPRAASGLSGAADLTFRLLVFVALYVLVAGLAQMAARHEIGRKLRIENRAAGPAGRLVPVDRIETLAVRNLTVRLPGHAEALFSNFSLSLSRGEKLALVGPSGAGKSTVAKILLGLIRPTAGSVAVNGIAHDRIDRWSYMERLSYIDQWRPVSPVVARDFLFGHHPYDADLAWRILSVTGLDEKFRSLPMGISSIVSGALLSLGELNRLLISKMLIRASDMFIFDELLSGFDAETTGRIFRHLSSLNAAALVISHDDAIVSRCDRVVRIGPKGR